MNRLKHAVIVKDLPKPVMHYSPCILSGDFIFTSGALATDYRTGLAPEANLPYLGSNIKQQARVIFRAINKLVTTGGSSLKNIIKLDEFLENGHEAALFFEERIAAVPEAASSTVTVNPFIIPGCKLEVDAIALKDNSKFAKEVICTPKVPLGLGPQAVKAGPWIFVSGLMATDYQNGVAPEAQVNKNNWYGSAIKSQTRYIFRNLSILLEEAGSSLEHIVKARVDLLDLQDFSGFEEIWKECFPKLPPARTVVKVKDIGVVGCLVQINVIAVTKNGGIHFETVKAPRVPSQLTHEPHAIKAGNFLFLSGQMPFDERGLAPQAQIDSAVPYYGQNIKRQMSYTLERVKAICEAGGTSLDNMVKRLVFHTDLTELDQSFEIWQEYFPKHPPASTTVEIEGPHLVSGSTIILDLIAAVP